MDINNLIDLVVNKYRIINRELIKWIFKLKRSCINV